MEAILEALKKKNRTLLEMFLGMLAWGILLQLGFSFFAGDRLLPWSLSCWLGIALAVLAALHMFRTLDRSLDLGEAAAQKAAYVGYLTRYLVLVAVVLLVIVTKYLNPLILFAAYMSLKVTVYLQPFTHKVCNKIFHETDPEPEPEPCQEQETDLTGDGTT